MRNYGLFPIRAQRSSPDERDAGRQPNRHVRSREAGRPAPSLAERLKAARLHRLWTLVASAAAFMEAWYFLGLGHHALGYGILSISMGLLVWSLAMVSIVADLEREEEAEEEKFRRIKAEMEAAVERALQADRKAVAA